MKKDFIKTGISIIFGLLFISLVLGLTSCSENSEPTNNLVAQVSNNPTQAKQNTDSLTTESYKGYPVYVGKKGGKYILRTSKKTGKVYRQYLPKKDKGQ